MKKLSKILLAILVFSFFIVANVFAVDESDITVNKREKYSEAVNSVEPEYTTIEQAGKQLREGLKRRNNVILVTFITNSKLDDSIFKKVVNEAVKHTGVPTEGDYIYWQCSEWEADFDWKFVHGIYYYTLTYKFSYYTTYEQEKEMDIAVANLLNTLDLSGTDYEKITKIYNYICNNIVYNYSSKENLIYSAYGALINKKAVCQGVATLFYRLALENNIDARVISGIADGGPHGWNIVKIGNQYYNMDSTWDINNVNSKYKYFMVSDNNFKDHKRDSKFTTNEFYSIYPMGSENYIFDNNKADLNKAEVIKTEYVADLKIQKNATDIVNSQVIDTVLEDTIKVTESNDIWNSMRNLVADFDYLELNYERNISYIVKNGKTIFNILKITTELRNFNNICEDIIFEVINYNNIKIKENEIEALI